MAKYDPTHPALCLQGRIDSSGATGVDRYLEADETGMYGQFMSYEMTIENISNQAIYDMSTREPGKYTAIDIKAGDYITNDSGKIVLRIKSVIQKTDEVIQLIAEDVDGLSFRQYGINTPVAFDTIIFFELSENGLPVLVGDIVDSFVGKAIDRLQSRFSIDEDDERYRFEHVSPANVDVGDVVTVDTNGDIVKHGSLGAAKIPLGTAVTKSKNGKIIYVKPFNKIIDNYPDPTILNGNPGDVYYTDPNNAGGITTTETAGESPVYMQLRNAIPTIITTSATTPPGNSDVVEINNIEIHNSTTYASIEYFKTEVNLQTSQTGVEASTEPEPTIVESQGGTMLHQQILDVVVLISQDGGVTNVYPAITIGDGTTSATVSFNPSLFGLQTYDYLNDPNMAAFQVIRAEEVVSMLNTSFTNNSINLEALVVAPPVGVSNGNLYNGIKITGTSSNASIQITNISPDAFGTNFAGTASATGLTLNTPVNTNANLTFVREDGGNILITGSPITGGWINQNGVTSSSAGTPALLLMIEGSGEQEVPVVLGTDYDMSPNQTTGNLSPTGLYITNTPFIGSKVEVKVNGIDANLGQALDYYQKDCFFSPDGTTVRNFNQIQAGDQLYWNGVFAGFELDPDDDIDFIYQTSNSNA